MHVWAFFSKSVSISHFSNNICPGNLTFQEIFLEIKVKDTKLTVLYIKITLKNFHTEILNKNAYRVLKKEAHMVFIGSMSALRW